ncbi:MAG TPA: hypothetical protein VEQ40_04810 [Pyrinomonadaceae bacterium]|nr:hypothetical protein [Pyrinomonadaceae bacterium]
MEFNTGAGGLSSERHERWQNTFSKDTGGGRNPVDEKLAHGPSVFRL